MPENSRSILLIKPIMNTNQLQTMGMQELSANELENIDGGSFINWLKVVGAAVGLVIALIDAI